jgi:hypothetical protein
MGTVVSGTFSGINWGKNSKFLQVELNTTGGTTYTDLGTSQMMSVPYALYAGQTTTTAGNNIGAGFTMISNFSPNSPYNWTTALNYCLGLVEGGYSDWRLPRIEEWLAYSEQNGVPLYKGWTTSLTVDGKFFIVYNEYVGPRSLGAEGAFSTSEYLQLTDYRIKCVR